MKIAFLGLGNMGAPMARNIAKAGHELTVWNRTRSKAEELKSNNVRVADSAADAVRGAEVVFTMLADDNAVSELFDTQKVQTSFAPGAIHVSSSTISVAMSEHLRDLHHEAKQQYVAAPVFGRPDAAEAAKLFVVAAGPKSAVQKCEPLLSTIGQRTFVIGEEQPKANVVKLTGNFLIASMLECLGEAVALVRKHGVDPQQYIELLTNSIFNVPVYKNYGAQIVSEKYEPAGFKLKLGLKDVRLVLQAADTVSVPMPVAGVLRDHAIEGVANGMGDMDWSSIAKVVANNAGLGKAASGGKDKAA